MVNIIFAANGIGEIVFLGIFVSSFLVLVLIDDVAGEYGHEHEHGQHQNDATMDQQFKEEVVVQIADKCEKDPHFGINAVFEKRPFCRKVQILKKNLDDMSKIHQKAASNDELTSEGKTQIATCLLNIRNSIKRDVNWNLTSEYYAHGRAHSISSSVAEGKTLEELSEELKQSYETFLTDYAELKIEVAKPIKNRGNTKLDSQNLYKLLCILEAMPVMYAHDEGKRAWAYKQFAINLVIYSLRLDPAAESEGQHMEKHQKVEGENKEGNHLLLKTIGENWLKKMDKFNYLPEHGVKKAGTNGTA